MLNYTATIFAESGSSLSPNMAAIVIGVIQLAGSYCSTLLVERAGRKVYIKSIKISFLCDDNLVQFLLSFSAFTTGLGLACLGIYSYLRSLEYDMSSFGWLPVASFSMTIFVASLGVLTLPFMVIAEIMPEKVTDQNYGYSQTCAHLHNYYTLDTILRHYFLHIFRLDICVFDDQVFPTAQPDAGHAWKHDAVHWMLLGWSTVCSRIAAGDKGSQSR